MCVLLSLHCLQTAFMLPAAAGMFNAITVQPLVAAERVVFYRGASEPCCVVGGADLLTS